MEEENEYNEFNEEGGLLDRIKESPRTVSALIIILIVAAAIYAFSGDEAANQEGQTDELAAVTEEEVNKEEAEIKEEEDTNTNKEDNTDENTVSKTESTEAKDSTTAKQAAQPKQPQVAAETTTTQPEAAELEAKVTPTKLDAPLPEATRTNSAFVEVAQSGEGVTHLSRRAANKWLSENQTSYTITDEHRIFIEDYIKDYIGSKSLNLGDSVEINFTVVQDAVAAAGNLTEGQLSNLTQYTSALK